MLISPRKNEWVFIDEGIPTPGKVAEVKLTSKSEPVLAVLTEDQKKWVILGERYDMIDLKTVDRFEGAKWQSVGFFDPDDVNQKLKNAIDKSVIK